MGVPYNLQVSGKVPARDYLGGLWDHYFTWKNEKDRADNLRARLTDGSVTINLNPDPVQNGTMQDSMAISVAEIADIEREADRYREEYLTYKTDVLLRIYRLPHNGDDDIYIRFLESRYVPSETATRRTTIEDVARQIDRSVSWTKALQRDSLKIFSLANPDVCDPQ